MPVKSYYEGLPHEAAFSSNGQWASAESASNSATENDINRLLKDISQDTVALNAKLIQVTKLLAEQGAWTAVVRLLVGVGGYQMAEIAEATQVMRSTVGRWYNGETSPSKDQMSVYQERLITYIRETRQFELSVTLDSLVDEGVDLKSSLGSR